MELSDSYFPERVVDLIIRVTNVKDFIGFIHNAIHNGESFPRVLFSKNATYGPISIDGKKDHIDFVYALFTTKLSVLFTGNVKADVFNVIESEILRYRDREPDFRIQVFERITFDGKFLNVENELDVI